MNESSSPPTYFPLRLIIGGIFFGAMLTFVRYLLNGEANMRLFFVVAGLGITIGVVSFFSNAVELVVYKALSGIASLIEKSITLVLLAVFYYLILYPCSLILKLAGHKAIRKSFDRKIQSYWQDADSNSGPESYFRQF